MSGFTLVGYIYRCQACGSEHAIPVSSLGNLVMCWHERLRPPRRPARVDVSSADLKAMRAVASAPSSAFREVVEPSCEACGVPLDDHSHDEAVRCALRKSITGRSTDA